MFFLFNPSNVRLTISFNSFRTLWNPTDCVFKPHMCLCTGVSGNNPGVDLFYDRKCRRAPHRCRVMRHTLVFTIKVLYSGLCKSRPQEENRYAINHITMLLCLRPTVSLCQRQATPNPVNQKNANHSHFMSVTSACVIGPLTRKGSAFQLRPDDPSH